MDAPTILRTARREARLTLRELADRAGTSHATLSAYEHAAKAPTIDTFARVLRAAGYVLDGTLTRRIEADPRTGLARRGAGAGGPVPRPPRCRAARPGVRPGLITTRP